MLSVQTNWCMKTIYRVTMLISILLLVKNPLLGQAKWQKLYVGLRGGGLQQIGDDYIIVGHSTSLGSGDLSIVKLDKNGNEIWINTYGIGGVNESGASVIAGQDGGYIIAGTYTKTGPIHNEGYILKIDEDGNVLWSKSYDHTTGKFFRFIRQTIDGNYIIVGTQSQSLIMLKLDVSGNIIWQNLYDQATPTSLEVLPDGSFAVGGSYQGSGQGLYFIKVDANGNKLWAKAYSAGGSNWGGGMAEASDGGFVLNGQTKEGMSLSVRTILKIDANGNIEWEKGYDWDFEQEAGWNMISTCDDHFVIFGDEYRDGSEDEDLFMMKFDNNGDVVWSKSYGTESDHGEGDVPDCVIETNDGGYMFAGTKIGTGDNGMNIVKTDADGSCGCEERDVALVNYPSIAFSATDISGSETTLSLAAVSRTPTVNALSPSIGISCLDTNGTPGALGQIQASPDSVYCTGDSVSLTAPNGGETYSWSTGDTALSITVEVTDSISIFSVEITTDGSCALDSLTRSKTIYLIDTCNQDTLITDPPLLGEEMVCVIPFIPNAYSLNSLNNNAWFFQENQCELLTLEFYNKKGKKLFALDGNNSWDGALYNLRANNHVLIYHASYRKDDGEIIHRSGNMIILE